MEVFMAYGMQVLNRTSAGTDVPTTYYGSVFNYYKTYKIINADVSGDHDIPLVIPDSASKVVLTPEGFWMPEDEVISLGGSGSGKYSLQYLHYDEDTKSIKFRIRTYDGKTFGATKFSVYLERGGDV